MTSRADAAGESGGDRSRRAQVIGTGLIGGSIGVGLRERGWWVTGRDIDDATESEALRRGLIDEAGTDGTAEVVFVAVPAGRVAEVVDAALRTHRKAVVTDVSGVKARIVAAVDDGRFVGGHPMAGSEEAGPGGAGGDLFEGTLWVLTPREETDLAAFDRVQAIIAELGAEVVVLPAEVHDKMVAVVSHVPHLVAATLVNLAREVGEDGGTLERLAAGGFRDMTRIAAGDPGIWPDVCGENAGAIGATLAKLQVELASLEDAIARDDRGELMGRLVQASEARRGLPARATRPDHLGEIRVPVPDRQGVLAEITSLAAAAQVNIYDIEIAHSAEGPRGVLILIVEVDDSTTMCTSLEGAGYRPRWRRLG